MTGHPSPRLLVCSSLSAVILASLSLSAAGQSLDFETPGEGWTVASGAVTWNSQDARQRKSCLSLEATTRLAAWAVSEPLDGFPPGACVELSLFVRRLTGSVDLALTLTSAPGTPAGPLLWRGNPCKDMAWHRLALRIVTGLGRPRIALGAVGESGTWLVDDLRTAPVTIPPVTRPVRKELVPGFPESLPQGWQPEGDLDLKQRDIMGIESYYISPGPLELNPQRELTLNRGERTGMFLDALSRGNASKTLQVQVLGPSGWGAETMEVQISGKRVVPLNIPLQPMLVGPVRLKVRFTCEGETREMPLLVNASRYYPALGVSWEGAPPEDLAPLAALPVQFHQLNMSAANSLMDLARVIATGADASVVWDGDERAALRAFERISPPLWAMTAAAGCDEAGPQGVARLRAVVVGSAPHAAVLTAPLALLSTPGGLLPEALPDAGQAEAILKRADALRIRLPGLPGSAVVRETLDGRTAPGSMQAWQWFDQTWNLGPLRTALRRADWGFPLYADSVSGLRTGDPGLDALLLSRVLVQVFAAGANAVTIPGRAAGEAQIALLSADDKPDQILKTVFGELSRELAGVRSLNPPGASEIAGAPGAAGSQDKPVAFRHFLRGDEGVVAMWNNSQVRQRVAADVRCRPVQTRLLRLSWPGEAVQREFVGDFQWDPIARHWGQPAVYVDLEPLQFVILSLKLRDAHQGWLREVGPRPPDPPKLDPMGMKEFDEELWGPKR